MGKDFFPNFLQPFLENTDKGSCNDGSRELIPVFHSPHQICRPSPSAVARTLEYLVGVPSKAASSRREKKQVWISTQKARGYLEVIAAARNEGQNVCLETTVGFFKSLFFQKSYLPFTLSLNLQV